MMWHCVNTVIIIVCREEVARILRGAPFLVCDSTRTHGLQVYTLVVNKGGIKKYISIINKNGKFGFVEPVTFNSVQDLIEYYKAIPLTKYNRRLDITLSNPVSRFEVESDVSHDLFWLGKLCKCSYNN